MPEGMISGLLIVGLILTIPFSLLAVWILGKTRKDPIENEVNDRLQMPASEWIWKLVDGVLLSALMLWNSTKQVRITRQVYKAS
jgi:hypothetical protein